MRQRFCETNECREVYFSPESLHRICRIRACMVLYRILWCPCSYITIVMLPCSPRVGKWWRLVYLSGKGLDVRDGLAKD